MNKEKYIEAEMEIVSFDSEDIITTSGLDINETPIYCNRQTSPVYKNTRIPCIIESKQVYIPN